MTWQASPSWLTVMPSGLLDTVPSRERPSLMWRVSQLEQILRIPSLHRFEVLHDLEPYRALYPLYTL